MVRFCIVCLLVGKKNILWSDRKALSFLFAGGHGRGSGLMSFYESGKQGYWLLKDALAEPFDQGIGLTAYAV